MSSTSYHSVDSIQENEIDLGLDLLRQNNLSEPFVFSPFSIAIALGMMHAGAKGETKDQIRKVLAQQGTDEDFLKFYGELARDAVKKNDQIEVNFANKLFLRNDFKPHASYLEAISKEFLAGAQNVDFSDGDAAATEINSFVEQSTGGKITNMVEGSSLGDTVAMMVNALYFKARWQDIFYSSSTIQRPFFSAENTSREIDFMNEYGVDRFFYDGERAQVLALYYEDRDYAFNIILPKQRFGLSSMLSKFTGCDLANYINSVRMTYLDIRIPKMKIEKEMDLKSGLESVGITNLFRDDADLSALADGELKVTEAKHKALIEVDEEGTVAAATTTFKIEAEAGVMATPVEFTADHPFLFCLTYRSHPLFMGVFA